MLPVRLFFFFAVPCSSATRRKQPAIDSQFQHCARFKKRGSTLTVLCQLSLGLSTLAVLSASQAGTARRLSACFYYDWLGVQRHNIDTGYQRAYQTPLSFHKCFFVMAGCFRRHNIGTGYILCQRRSENVVNPQLFFVVSGCVLSGTLSALARRRGRKE